jgi:hemoglobin/transferrin/lactoferrin receptor protein
VADAELDRAHMGDLKDLFIGIASVSVGGGIPVAKKILTMAWTR